MDILIVGTEHSGIDEVAQVLSGCDGARVVKEYRPLDVAFSAWQEMEKWDGYEEEKGKLEFALTRFLLNCYVRDEKVLIDTHTLGTGKSIEFLKFVRRFFPAAQIVVMVRNPRDCIRKMCQNHHGMGRTKYKRRLRPIRECLNSWAYAFDGMIEFSNKDPFSRMFQYETVTKEEIEDFLDLKTPLPFIFDKSSTQPLGEDEERALRHEISFRQGHFRTNFLDYNYDV